MRKVLKGLLSTVKEILYIIRFIVVCSINWRLEKLHSEAGLPLLLLLNVDKEFYALCLDCEVAKEEEVNHCHNCHYHINSRSNYLLCYGLDNTQKSRSQVEGEIESTILTVWAQRTLED